jgi:hypothetical protein
VQYSTVALPPETPDTLGCCTGVISLQSAGGGGVLPGARGCVLVWPQGCLACCHTAILTPFIAPPAPCFTAAVRGLRWLHSRRERGHEALTHVSGWLVRQPPAAWSSNASLRAFELCHPEAAFRPLWTFPSSSPRSPPNASHSSHCNLIPPCPLRWRCLCAWWRRSRCGAWGSWMRLRLTSRCWLGG